MFLHRLQMFLKIDELKNFANFLEKHLCWSLFFKCVATVFNLIKNRLPKFKYLEIQKILELFQTTSQESLFYTEYFALCEKCPNTKLFLARIHSECGKIWTRNNSVFEYFSRSFAYFYRHLGWYLVCTK